MKRMRLRDETVYGHDVDLIVKAFAERGMSISKRDACAAWRKYSRDLDARWFHLPGDGLEIVNAINEYIEEDAQHA